MSTILDLYQSDALLWLEFGGIYTDAAGNKVVDNLALRGDAPKTVTCGAGAACPTQLAGRRGVVFAGAQWIDCGLIDRFERTDAFTLVVVTSTTADQSLLMYMATADAAASPVRGVQFYTYLGNRVYIDMFSTPTTNSVSLYGTGGVTTRAINSVCVTHSGGSNAASVLGYFNGVAAAKTVSADTLSATIKNGKPWLLGARYNGAAKAQPYIGTMHFAAIFPLAASAIQIQNLHKCVMRRINLP